MPEGIFRLQIFLAQGFPELGINVSPQLSGRMFFGWMSGCGRLHAVTCRLCVKTYL